jgi:hypothetical protein
MSDTAVLVVDMLNSYQHADAEELVLNVAKIIEPLTDLVRRARESDDVDLVYVNDNYGDFTAEFSDIVRSACDGARPDLVEPIAPTEGSRARSYRHRRLRAPSAGRGSDRCRRPHRRRAGCSGTQDDGAKYVRRAHACGRLPRLNPIVRLSPRERAVPPHRALWARIVAERPRTLE